MAAVAGRLVQFFNYLFYGNYTMKNQLIEQLV